MTCPDCRSENPASARFCHACGRALRQADASAHGRGHAYAVQPGENVLQFALISTVMPHTNRDVADNYRWALVINVALVLVFTVTGVLPAAVMAGAALVPVVYLVYLYDVNLWEDAPLGVVLSLFALTGVLSLIMSLVFFRWVFETRLLTLTSQALGGSGGLSVSSLLIFAVLLPVVAEVVKNIGPVLLARQPRFDDMIDGLTFGVAAGTAYAAFESFVAFSSVFTSGDVVIGDNLASWLVTILNVMIVKSIIYGTATGIAVASFSGLGEGYDGFTVGYAKNLLLAMIANAAYWLGVRLLAPLAFGQGLGLLWGLVIAAVLILRVRVLLQAALLEAALEDAASDHTSKRAAAGGGFCPECEMPLLSGAQFCVACGVSLRAQSTMARHHAREAHPEGTA